MSAPSAPLNVSAMMNRVLASLRLQEADRWLPSLSLDSFVLVEPNRVVMKILALELLSDKGCNTTRLSTTGRMVSSAVCEMMLEEPKVFLHKSHIDFFNFPVHPKRHEVIKIVARAIPTGPGGQMVECVATVRRDDEDVLVMTGKAYYASVPPSDVNARLSIAGDPLEKEDVPQI
ncbi:unnamed protein product [Caenorhabditis nigoni]